MILCKYANILFYLVYVNRDEVCEYAFGSLNSQSNCINVLAQNSIHWNRLRNRLTDVVNKENKQARVVWEDNMVDLVELKSLVRIDAGKLSVHRVWVY